MSGLVATMLRKVLPTVLAFLGLALLLAPLAGRGAEFSGYTAGGDAAHAAHGGHASDGSRDSCCDGHIAGTADASCPHCADHARGESCASHHGCCFGSAALPPTGTAAEACAFAASLNPRRPALHPLTHAADIFRPPRFLP